MTHALRRWITRWVWGSNLRYAVEDLLDDAIMHQEFLRVRFQLLEMKLFENRTCIVKVTVVEEPLPQNPVQAQRVRRLRTRWRGKAVPSMTFPTDIPRVFKDIASHLEALEQDIIRDLQNECEEIRRAIEIIIWLYGYSGQVIFLGSRDLEKGLSKAIEV